MTVYRLEEDRVKIRAALQEGARLVACLCAEWCSSCRAWQGDFEMLAEGYPDDCFVWIDIEDHPDLVAEVEFETFPVLLVQDKTVLYFMGPVRPVIATVEVLLQRMQTGLAVSDPGIFELIAV